MVALRESLLVWFAPERKLADDRPTLLHHFARKVPALLGIESVERGPQHSDRYSTGRKSALVRLGIYAKREAGDYAPARLGKIMSKTVRLVESVCCGAACADDRNRWERQCLNVAFDVKHKRMASRLAKHFRISVIGRGQYRHAVSACLVELRTEVYRAAMPRNLSVIRLPCGGDAAEALGKIIHTDRADVVSQVERDIRLSIAQPGQCIYPLAKQAKDMIYFTPV